MTKNKILAIIGPTAVGKTSLTLTLSQAFQAEIISCDSVQLFKDLDIGSAKPDARELKQVPHHLISVYPPSQRINVAIYKQQAEAAIQQLQQKNTLPLLSGGTGMYFNSLYYGLFSQNSRDNDYRQLLEDRVNHKELASLYRELVRKDPQSEHQIKANDKVRIIRALEVLHCTGSSIFELQQHNEKMDLEWYIIGLDRDRADLYQRIEERVDQMLEQGLIEETKALIDKYGADAYGLGSIGYRHVRDYLQGVTDQDTMIETLKRDTRRYAKRQLTWFRKNKDINWYHPHDTDTIIQHVKEFLS